MPARQLQHHLSIVTLYALATLTQPTASTTHAPFINTTRTHHQHHTRAALHTHHTPNNTLASAHAYPCTHTCIPLHQHTHTCSTDTHTQLYHLHHSLHSIVHWALYCTNALNT